MHRGRGLLQLKKLTNVTLASLLLPQAIVIPWLLLGILCYSLFAGGCITVLLCSRKRKLLNLTIYVASTIIVLMVGHNVPLFDLFVVAPIIFVTTLVASYLHLGAAQFLISLATDA